MAVTVTFSEEVSQLLLALVAEENEPTTPEQMLTEMIVKMDKDLHQDWSRKQGRHTRVKCYKEKCAETGKPDHE